MEKEAKQHPGDSLSFDLREEREAIVEMCRAIGWSNDPDKHAELGEIAVRLVPRLLSALGELEKRDGGKFGEEVRDLLREHFMERRDGKALLAAPVNVCTLSVAFVPGNGAIANITLGFDI